MRKHHGVARWLMLILAISLMVAACSSSSPQDPGESSQNGAESPAEPEETEESQEPEAWEPTKHVTWIVPFSPGGGYDAYSRAIAEAVSAKLPDGLRVDVRNVTGASGNVGAETLKRSDPDGHTVAMIHNIFAAIHQIYEGENAIIHVTDDFTWVAGITDEPYVLFASARSGLETFDDVLAAEGPLRMGGPGATSLPVVVGAVLEEQFGIDFNYLTAYPGSGDVMTAAVRGEIDLSVFEVSSILPFVESGDLVPLVVFHDRPSDALPGTPSAPEVEMPEAILTSIRPIALPLGTPEPIVEYWVQMLEEALQDPDLLAWAEETEKELIHSSPDAVAERVSGVIAWLEPYEDLIQQTIDAATN